LGRYSAAGAARRPWPAAAALSPATPASQVPPPPRPRLARRRPARSRRRRRRALRRRTNGTRTIHRRSAAVGYNKQEPLLERGLLKRRGVVDSGRWGGGGSMCLRPTRCRSLSRSWPPTFAPRGASRAAVVYRNNNVQDAFSLECSRKRSFYRYNYRVDSIQTRASTQVSSCT
jgi:hypothetical protein